MSRPPRSLLLVIDDCQAGDALKVSGLVREVRAAHPAARLTLLVGEQARPVYVHSDVADRVVVSTLYRRRARSLAARRLAKAGELLRLAATIGRGHDLVIVFWWGSTALHLLSLWSGRRRGLRVGYAQRFPGLLTSRLGPYDFRSDDKEQNARLLREAGIADSADRPLELHPSESDTAWAKWFLRRAGLAGTPALVVLHPGSDWACQMWGQERWAGLADQLATRGAQLVFTGTAAEAAHIDAIRSRMRAPSVSAAGESTLTQLGALLAQAALCVCVDSAAYVVARAVSTPTVVIAGPTRPGHAAGAGPPPAVVNRAPAQLVSAIVACKEPKYPAGGCLDHDCPMAGLRDVEVADMLAAVLQTGLLPDAAPVAG